MTVEARIKDIVTINRETLPESTPPEWQFRYIDIGAVKEGSIEVPEEDISFASAPSRARRLASPGDTVVSTVRTYLRAVAAVPASEWPLVFSTGFAVLHPGSQVEPRFLSHYCQSKVFIEEVVARSVGVSYPAINASEIGDLRLRVPDLDEQRRIADFLDAETARIDRLLELRERQVEVLNEWALGVIASELAGGRRLSEPRKSTGLSWLPSIPDSWSLGPVYAYYHVRLGKMLNPERATGEHPRPYLRNANVHWFTLSVDDLALMSFEPGERIRYRLEAGDLVVCEGGAGVAEAAVWDGRVAECYYQKSLHRVRATAHLPVEWLMYWLRLAKASGVFASDGNIATIPHLTCEQLREYRIPVPPTSSGLLTELHEELDRVTRESTLLQRSSDLLGEAKQALITAAVTGQLDVTTARGAA